MSTVVPYAGAAVLLARYRSVEAVCRRMLDAAVEDDWDRVATLRAECGHLMEQARRLGAGTVLGRDDRRTKLQIMRRILQADARLRRLSSPWTERHEALLQGRRSGPVTGQPLN